MDRSGTTVDTLDTMTPAQLRDLAARAEASAEAKEREQAEGKYAVSGAVEVTNFLGYRGFVCLAKDGTRWYANDGGGWITSTVERWDPVVKVLKEQGQYPYIYANHSDFAANHWPVYGRGAGNG